MRKITLALGSLFLSVCASAQLSFAPFAAFNVSGYSFGETVPGLSMRYGAKAGVMADVQLSQNFYLQPGVYYAMNGFRLTSFFNLSANINTLEIPVNVTYKIGKPDGNRFFVSAGPYVGINMWGNITSSVTDLMGNYLGDVTEPLAFGNSSDSATNLRRFDWGVNVNAGYELASGLFARAYFQQGLQNLVPTTPGQSGTLRNYNFGVGVGYIFKHAPTTKKKAESNK